jgi:hypothetical protein
MKQTLGPDKSSNAQIARWASRCEEGDFWCKRESGPGRPLLSFGPTLSRFLSNHPFESAQILVAHFEFARDSGTIILARELDLKTFSRR